MTGRKSVCPDCRATYIGRHECAEGRAAAIQRAVAAARQIVLPARQERGGAAS